MLKSVRDSRKLLDLYALLPFNKSQKLFLRLSDKLQNDISFTESYRKEYFHAVECKKNNCSFVIVWSIL